MSRRGASIMPAPPASGTIGFLPIAQPRSARSVAVKTRLWIAYLAGVSGGFTRNSVGIFQTLASKRTRGPSGLPPSREHLYR